MNYFHFNNSYSTSANSNSFRCYYSLCNPSSTNCNLYFPPPRVSELNVLLALYMLLYLTTFTSNSSSYFYTFPAILFLVLVKHLFQFHSFLSTPLFPPLKTSSNHTKNITIYNIKKVHPGCIQFLLSKPDYNLLTTKSNILTTKLFLTTRTPYT